MHAESSASCSPRPRPRPARISFSTVKLPVLEPRPPVSSSPYLASSSSFFSRVSRKKKNDESQNPVQNVVRSAENLLQNAWARWGPDEKKVEEFFNKFLLGHRERWENRFLSGAAICSTSLALADNRDYKRPEKIAADRLPGGGQGSSRKGLSVPAGAEDEERVLISEILIQDKDGQDLEDAELLATVRCALKACKPNFALTTSEVQEDVHRIIDTGFFASCMPTAEDTRDGVRLIFKVESNQELKGLVCNGANVLPTRVVQDAFHDEYGKVVNIQRLNKVLDTLNGWYRDRGLFGQVTDVEILSDGIIRVQVAEAEVHNINIRFLDRKTGEPTTGKTQPETLLRQLTTKKGQVYSLQQGRRDVETVFTMGIMEDVNLVPQPAGDTGMVDLTMNVVERVTGGFSAGGGLSGNGITNGALSGLVGSFAYSHRNAFGRNQKLNISLERGQVDSMFRVNYTDPWIEGDDKRTSRSINIQNSRSPGTIVHGIRRDAPSSVPVHGGVTIGRLMAGVDYSRPLRPKWSGTAGINFQRAGARDDHGQPKVVDFYGGPLTFSGRAYDDMLVAKLEIVYTDSGDNGSSQLVFNTEQGLPIAADWLFFNRINVRARQGLRIGPMRCIASFSGGSVIGDLAPHEAFPIGGTNSVRGYDEGAVGSGRSCIVASGEISLPLVGPVEGAVFADYGGDLRSGKTVPGDPAGQRFKPGSGYGYGAGLRVDSPLGPLRLEYAFNDQHARRFHFGIGYRN
ncbi:outer membrane protein insertion porin family [Marchantia polymorpha subsp. ruderalis]|uniref:Bacterial surface antigen (D15) domain-containing protein n=2 Tax=Marchantia polymorpha TaxID=3197 RepID=A0AAF6AR56_MARPO|nr:hypothetical protein MARPO_0001s0065 [Marchantia polymorpha]BBM98926.1 hypothetical protein Mp_1g17250 [Marchantia polymorpha subsp. ruderalis]|eukprot:PTQ50002.1 hypothetical protein MARPO_0001s0065 [Marchantia polymorpha]